MYLDDDVGTFQSTSQKVKVSSSEISSSWSED